MIHCVSFKHKFYPLTRFPFSVLHMHTLETHAYYHNQMLFGVFSSSDIFTKKNPMYHIVIFLKFKEKKVCFLRYLILSFTMAFSHCLTDLLAYTFINQVKVYF